MSKPNLKMNQLDKLQQLAPFPMDPQFITGYLTFGVPLESAAEVKTIAEQIMTMRQDKLITSFNVLQLLAMLKCDVLNVMESEGKKNMSVLMDPFLTELVLDNGYLHNKYFQKGISASEIIP